MENLTQNITPVNGNIKAVTTTVIWLMIIAAVVTVVVVFVAKTLLSKAGEGIGGLIRRRRGNTSTTQK